MDRYLTFDPWWGGMNNVRMSYELAAAMSVVTNRKLVIPPKVYVLFFSDHSNKNSYFDFWKIWDRKAFTSQFDCINYEDVPELQKYNSDSQYFDGICKDYPCITFGDQWSNHGPQHWMDQYMVHGEILEDTRYKKWKNEIRPSLNLNKPDKIIHFPSSLFGYWYFHVYHEQKHNIKEKLRKGMKLRAKYRTKAKKLMPKDYDAVHIRRGDFLQTRRDSTLRLYDTLADSLKNRVRDWVPLFIATDEKDKSLFDFLKKDYDIKFLSDYTDADNVDALALDMEICANAYHYFGSQYSTFSDYIHILRHYKGKNDYSRVGLNYEKPINNQIEMPWLNEPYAWDNLWVHLY